MPPAASTGVGATASTTSGTSTMVAISPVCPPASVPCATMRSTPAALVALGVGHGAGQGGHSHSGVVRPRDERGRRWPEGARHQGDVMGEGHVEQGLVALGGHVGEDVALRPGAQVGGELGHVVATQDVVDELLLGGGEELAHGIGVEPALLGAGVLGREEEVDAVAAAVGLLLDPREVDLELVGGVGHGTQDPEPTGPGDRGHHVTAVAEGQDRELHPEHVGDLGLHVCLLVGATLPSVGRCPPVGPLPG